MEGIGRQFCTGLSTFWGEEEGEEEEEEMIGDDEFRGWERQVGKFEAG